MRNIYEGLEDIARRNHAKARDMGVFRVKHGGRTYTAQYDPREHVWDVTCDGEHVCRLACVRPAKAKADLRDYLNI